MFLYMLKTGGNLIDRRRLSLAPMALDSRLYVPMEATPKSLGYRFDKPSINVINIDSEKQENEFPLVILPGP